MRTRAGLSIIVLAKVPVAGRVKTRLCPPLTPPEAASLARAALEDTLGVVLETPASGRVAALDGPPGPWLPRGFEMIRQRGGGLDERIACAFDDVGGPALLIGSDTPQISSMLLAAAGRALLAPGIDAVLGDAVDGGWWIVGLRRAIPSAFIGVPMSTRTTGVEQMDRLLGLGLRVARMPSLRDVDRIDDARAVAAEAPRTRFAATFRSMSYRGAETEETARSLVRP
jgi:glycosyltransferase A (GT-A) superfamily protein (DUF2064 family)